MTKIFNLKQNPVISYLTNHYDESQAEIVEYGDSIHMFLPINISQFLLKNELRLLSFLRKMNVSINGLITTSDQKVLEIRKPLSYAANNIRHSTPLLISFQDFIYKISIANNSLTSEERSAMNREIRDINLWNVMKGRTNPKVSFLELMKLCNVSFSNSATTEHMLMFPGGQVAVHDRSLMHTLVREVSEEVNIKLNVEYNPTTLIYHNIFDKLTEKFYHNILISAPVAQFSYTLNEAFKENFEVRKLQFHDIKNERYKAIYNILLRKR